MRGSLLSASRISPYISILVFIIILVLPSFHVQIVTDISDGFEECTSVIITGTAAKDGRTILMKNRDTGDTMNSPVYYAPANGHYGYTMVNTYWMGINEKGLAVMNTLVSALAFDGSGFDNGGLNRWIVEHCETVDQVCYELNNTNSEIGPGKRYGGTCVGVIDRFGKGAFIEVSGNGAYARFIVNGYDSQANHPRYYPGYASGPSGRDQYALDIMDRIRAEKGVISWQDVVQNVSRYVNDKEQKNLNFSISGEISNSGTQAAMVAVSGDPRYEGRLNCVWGEYGNPPMVGLFAPSIAYAGSAPSIIRSFWNEIWKKRSYTQDTSGNYNPARVRETQNYAFFAEDYTFMKYDELVNAIEDGLSDSQLKSRLQAYINHSVQTATQIYIAQPKASHYNVTSGGQSYKISVISNSTIGNFQFQSNPNIEISFNVTASSSGSGFCYVKIPTDLCNGNFTINVGSTKYVVDNPPQYDGFTVLNFTCTHPNQVKISNIPPDVWAIVGPKEQIPEMNNLFWLFGNQTIPYVHLYPNQVTSYETIKQYAGIVTWTNPASSYNATAIKQFARNKPVISHILDFCKYDYPTLNGSTRTLYTTTVSYVSDWGNFYKNDLVEMHNGTNYLTTVIASDLARLSNITTIARYNSTRTTLFHMAGANPGSGFYVLDLYATRPNSYESGNWHIFPAIANAATIKLGKYCRWMTSGLTWRSFDWVYSWMADFTNENNDIVRLQNIGTSVNGRQIKALFIGHGARYFIADAAIHGNEKAGTHSLMRFAELVIEWYRTDLNWVSKLSQYTLILVPILNPDGYVAGTRENDNGKDLNRQFPPAATTTEPEAWALRWLMGNYTPTQYVSLHIGWDNYPLDVFYTESEVAPYGDYALWAVNDGNLMFQDLKHWGAVYDTFWTGKYHYIGPHGSYSGFSATYAFFQHKTMAITAEHWGSINAQLHAQEFHIIALLSLLSHHDQAKEYLIHSSAFITKATLYDETTLMISLDKTLEATTSTSETKIYCPNNSKAPEHAFIDNTEKQQGSGWTWNNSTRIITVTNANISIVLEWSAYPPWDLNQDGRVDISDVYSVSKAYGSSLGSPKWNPKADLNADGAVDVKDAYLLCSHFGEVYT